MGSYDNLNLNLCETLYARARRARRRRTTPTTTPTGRAGDACPTGRLGDRRAAVLHRQPVPGAATATGCSSPTTRAAASGSCRRAPTGCPTPRSSRRSPPARPGSSTSIQGPDGNALLPRPQRRHRPADQLLRAERRADRARDRRRRRAARSRSRCSSTARRRPTPTGDALTYAWDLDGDGDYDDATGVAADPHLHGAGRRHRAAARDRPRRAARGRHVTVTAGRAADRADRHAGRGATGRSATTIAFSGGATDGQGAACRPPGCLAADCCSTAASGGRELPHAPGPDVDRGRERLVRGARPRVPVLSGARADRDRRGRADATRSRGGSTRGRST